VSVPVAVFVFGAGDIVALIVTLNRLVDVAIGKTDTDDDAWLSAVGAAEGDEDELALGENSDGDGTADDEPRTVAVSLREPSAVDDDDVVGDDVRTAPTAKREPAAVPT
jgi:hypothetical protein